MAWYNNNWTKRKKITIASSQVDSDLIDFPVYVDLSAIAGISNHEGIRVTKADGTTEVAREVLGSDVIHFTTDGALSSTADTDFYIYYGNASANNYAPTDTYGRNAVWADYLAVWHLNNDPTGSIIDSTGNGFDGTPQGSMTSGDLVSGKLASGALDFDGTDDFIQFPDTSALTADNTEKVSYQIWVQADAISNYKGLLQTSRYMGLFGCSDGGWSIQSNGDNAGTCASGTNIADGNWHKLTGIFIEGTKYLGYENGSLVFDVVTTDTESASEQGRIGARVGSTTDELDGRLQEARIRKSEISADWEDAENTNHSTPTTFYTVGTEEEVVTETHSISVDYVEVSFTTSEQTIDLTATQDGNEIDLEWTYSG